MTETRSDTREVVGERFRLNSLLHSPMLAPMRQGASDLSADQVSGALPPQAIAYAVEALEQGNTHYVDVPGVAALRERVAGFLKQLGISEERAEQAMVTAGMQESRFLSIQVVGQQFNSLAIPAVVHPGVRQAIGVRPLKITLLEVDTTGGHLPSVDSIRAVMEGGSRLVYLESPSRLTGAAYDAATVQQIAVLAVQYDATVIWDQGLAPWLPTGTGSCVSIGAIPEMTERSVLIGEAWPGMGLESWAVGYLAAPSRWLTPITSQKQVMSICTSTPSQFAAIEAADHYAAVHCDQFEQLADLHHQAHQLAEQSGLHPLAGGAVNIVALRSESLELQLAPFNVADGAAFGAPGVLRMTITFDNGIADALRGVAATHGE